MKLVMIDHPSGAIGRGRAEDALEGRIFCRRQLRGEFAQGYITDKYKTGSSLGAIDGLTEEIDASLIESDVFYWSRDMTEVVWQLGEHFPLEWSYAGLGSLVSECGLYWFEKAIVVDKKLLVQVSEDEDDTLEVPAVMAIDAIQWVCSKTSLLILSWVTIYDQLGNEGTVARAFATKKVSEKIKAYGDEDEIEVGPRVGTLVVPSLSWAKGRPLSEIIKGDVEQGFDVHMTKFVAASFEFVQQKIVTSGQAEVSRSVRKRCEESKVSDRVRMIALRKRERESSVEGEEGGEGEEKREIDWKNQWWVGRHWRHYENGKTVLIEPYTKGPVGKPLKPYTKPMFVVKR